MRELNKAQVAALFEREAVLLGTEGRVPGARAAALFGQASVDHARCLDKNDPGRYCNGYGVGDYTMIYLTLRGFQAAASFHNVQVLKEG